MENPPAALHGGDQGGGVPEITPGHLHRKPCQRFGRAGQYPDLPARGEELSHHGAADKAGAPGYQGFGHFSSIV